MYLLSRQPSSGVLSAPASGPRKVLSWWKYLHISMLASIPLQIDVNGMSLAQRKVVFMFGSRFQKMLDTNHTMPLHKPFRNLEMLYIMREYGFLMTLLA